MRYIACYGDSLMQERVNEPILMACIRWQKFIRQ